MGWKVGDTVWIRLPSGEIVKGTIISIGGDAAMVHVNGTPVRVPVGDLYPTYEEAKNAPR